MTERFVDPNRVFGRCIRDGLIIGVVTGALSGTVAFPVLGTIIGPVVALFLAVPVSLVAAAVISRSVRSPGTVEGYHRRIDVTLAVIALGTAGLAVGWISLGALVGPWPSITMLVSVLVGLVIVRPGLHRLAQPHSG